MLNISWSGSMDNKSLYYILQQLLYLTWPLLYQHVYVEEEEIQPVLDQCEWSVYSSNSQIIISQDIFIKIQI
jgi:hypothetical protein